MGGFVGSKYPLLAKEQGPIEQYSKTVDLSTVDGVYLDFLVAASYRDCKNVYIAFDMALVPSNVEVETMDGRHIQNWTLGDVDTDEFRRFAAELGVDETSNGIEELARRVLVCVNGRPSLTVPAYRYQ